MLNNDDYLFDNACNSSVYAYAFSEKANKILKELESKNNEE